MSREKFAIIARFSSNEELLRAFSEASDWLPEYCERRDAEFDEDDVWWQLDTLDERSEKEFPIPLSEIKDDELTVILPSWGGGIDKLEKMFIKNGAVKVVEFGEHLNRTLVYMKAGKFKPPMRKGDIIGKFAEDLKQGKVKGLPKLDRIRTKVRKGPK